MGLELLEVVTSDDNASRSFSRDGRGSRGTDDRASGDGYGRRGARRFFGTLRARGADTPRAVDVLEAAFIASCRVATVVRFDNEKVSAGGREDDAVGTGINYTVSSINSIGGSRITGHRRQGRRVSGVDEGAREKREALDDGVVEIRAADHTP